MLTLGGFQDIGSASHYLPCSYNNMNESHKYNPEEKYSGAKQEIFTYLK
jgi:hypothetical protein